MQEGQEEEEEEKEEEEKRKKKKNEEKNQIINQMKNKSLIQIIIPILFLFWIKLRAVRSSGVTLLCK